MFVFVLFCFALFFLFKLFLFFVLFLPASNLYPKVFTKLHDSSFKNTKFSSFWGGHIPPQTPPCVLKWAFGTVMLPPPKQIITKNVEKTDLGPWLGGTCNFEVGEEFGEGFCRQCLALGNNSYFLEEWTPLPSIWNLGVCL